MMETLYMALFCTWFSIISTDGQTITVVPPRGHVAYVTTSDYSIPSVGGYFCRERMPGE